ncbi:MAG: hypothetical protein MR743_06580 [Oscillospiraceae bacterium]|nr:hypothetical protein [Oscillospiraceae bacterium]
MQTTVAKTPRNNAIELWRFIFTVGISYGHFHSFGVRALGIDSSIWVMQGSRLLAAFVVLSGYFMMDGYMRKLQRGSLEGLSAASLSWGYFGKRYLALGPAAFIAVLVAFIARNVINGTSLSLIPTVLVNSIYEFFSLNQLGIVGVHETTSATALAEALDSGVTTTIWNGPLWYISALLIAGTLLYYMLSKNQDFFVGFLCPFIILGVYGYEGYNSILSGTGRMFSKGNLGFFDLLNGVLRVGAGMCVGVLLWYIVAFVKEHPLSGKAKGVLTVVNALLSVMFLYTMWFGIPWGEFQHELIQTAFIGILLINQDGLSKLYNQKWAGYLGRVSLYFYLCHVITTFVLTAMFPTMSYMALVGLFFVVNLVAAIVFKAIDDTVITRFIRKPILSYMEKKA